MNFTLSINTYLILISFVLLWRTYVGVLIRTKKDTFENFVWLLLIVISWLAYYSLSRNSAWIYLFSLAVNILIYALIRDRKGLYLIFNVFFNLLFLVTIKYQLASNHFSFLSPGIGPGGNTLLSNEDTIGISFYSFVFILFAAQLYQGELGKSQDSRITIAKKLTFTSVFFPHVLAGPIMDPSRMFRNLNPLRMHIRAVKNDRSSHFLILYGLFLKTGPAALALYYTEIAYAGYQGARSLSQFILFSIPFTFQIYFDFFAYSLVAFGTAQLFGICFPKNFKFPYHASNIREFWTRWHTSLYEFLKAVVYKPLIRNLPFPIFIRTIMGSFVVFTLSAVWHGWGVNYLIWAWINFFMLMVNKFIELFYISGSRVLFVTLYLPALIVSWGFFRLTGDMPSWSEIAFNHTPTITLSFPQIIVYLFFILYIIFEPKFLKFYEYKNFNCKPTIPVVGLLIVVDVTIYILGGQASTFLYFAF